MSRSSTLILIGVVSLLLPFSGFPSSIRAFFAVVLGGILLGLGVAERGREATAHQTVHTHAEPEPVPSHGVSPI